MRELPRGWEWVTFGEVASVDSNLVDPADYQDLPHIAPNYIESKTGRLLPYATVGEDAVTSSKHLFRAGHILYSKIRPYLAKAVIVDFQGLCSADMYPISTQLDPHWLLAWMLTPEFTAHAAGEQGRSVLPKINQKDLARLPVPVPPLAEQRRIVLHLQDAVSKIEFLEREVAAVARRLGFNLERRSVGQLRLSLLQAAFSGQLVTRDPSDEPAIELLERIGTKGSTKQRRSKKKVTS